MARHPKVFSRLYVAMVEAGEAAGVLDIVLDRVALQIEKEQSIKRRVKGAMVYPTIVLIFATLVLSAMLLFVVPIFVKIFAQLNGQLPTLTQCVLDVSNLLRHDWFIIFPLLGLTVFGFCRAASKTERGRAGLGPRSGCDPAADRRHGPEDHDRALLAHALDARRGGRRHHQGARDHRADLRQLRGRGGARRRAQRRPRGRVDRAAADRERRLPADGHPDGADRRGDRRARQDARARSPTSTRTRSTRLSTRSRRSSSR